MLSITVLVHALVLIIVLGLVVGLLYWLLQYIGLPEPFRKVSFVVLAVFSVLALIGIILSLAGYPVVAW